MGLAMLAPAGERERYAHRVGSTALRAATVAIVLRVGSSVGDSEEAYVA